MATRNLRTRASRLSSPAVHATPEPKSGDKIVEEDDDANEEDKEMEEDDGAWHEPPVRAPVPSFKDHNGLERLGVLELQQPLGVPPSQKLLQRLKLNLTRPSNRSTPLPDDEIMSQGLDSEVADTGSPMEADGPASTEPEPEPMAVLSPPRGRPSNKDMAAMQAVYPGEVTTPSPVKSTFQGTPSQLGASASKPTSIQEHLRQERVQNSVNRALEEAQEKGDYGLIPGLDRIRRNANDKRDLWKVLEAIAHQNPTPEQLHIFKKFIKKGLHKYQRQVAQQGPMGSQPFLGVDNSTLHNDHTPTFTSPFRTRAATGHLHPETPTSTTRRRKNGVVDDADASPKAKSTATKSPRRKRRGSNSSHSSTSSLSSAESVATTNSLINIGVSEEVMDEDQDSTAADGRGASRGGRQAGEAIPAAPRLRLVNKNSAIPPSDSNTDTNPISSKAISEKLKKSQQAREEAEQELAEIEKRRKRLLANSFVNYNYIDREEVNERRYHPRPGDDDLSHPPSESIPPPPVVHPDPIRYRVPSSSNQHLDSETQANTLMNGTSRKRNFDEFEESEDDSEPLTPLSSSSPAPPYEPPPPPPNAHASRSATPRTSTRSGGPPPKVARKSARVMISPNKPKNGGITAGFPRAGPGPARLAELGGGADSSQEDNDEHCASCGGEGILLCCDGCTNSFHHSCLEPPLDPEEEVEGTWYCPQCQAKQQKSTEEAKTFLGKALRIIDHVIPRAFALPDVYRGYFEGVRTGAEGEYVDFAEHRIQANAPKMNRNGFGFEEPNYKEPRDNKGNLLLCKGCGLSTNGKDLLPCDYCDAKWHLDCLDPPPAVRPRRGMGDKPTQTWRCPLHVDQDVSSLDHRLEAGPGDLGGAPKLRKPKNAKPLDVDFPRGFKNNGIIEVALEDDVDMSTMREVDMDGQVYRIPEQAIKLDFIDRVKRSWYEDKTFPDTANGRPPRFVERDYRPTKGVVLHEPKQTTITIKEPEFYKGAQALSIVETAKANAALRRKTLPEQQAILSLASIARIEEGSGPAAAAYTDALADLTNALVAEAPERVVESQVRDERASLQHLQALIDRRLRILDGREGEPVPVLPQSQSGYRESIGTISRAPTHKYSRAARAEKVNTIATNNYWDTLKANAPYRPLQPAPSALSPTNYTPYGPIEGLQNGQAHPGQYYGAAPPQQPGQSAAYPFPNTAQPSAPYQQDWQKQQPLRQNQSPWLPPSAHSPVRSPYMAGSNGNTQNFAGSPTTQHQHGTSSYPSTPLSTGPSALPTLAPAPPTQQSPPTQQAVFGPRPPSATATGMQRQSSDSATSATKANENLGAINGRRASLPGPVDGDNTSNHHNANAFQLNKHNTTGNNSNGCQPSSFGPTLDPLPFPAPKLPASPAAGAATGADAAAISEDAEMNIDPALFFASAAEEKEAKHAADQAAEENVNYHEGDDGDDDVDMGDLKQEDAADGADTLGGDGDGNGAKAAMSTRGFDATTTTATAGSTQMDSTGVEA